MVSNNNKFLRICIITSPLLKAGIVPVSHIIEILTSLSNELYLVTGNEGINILTAHDYLKGCSFLYSTKNNILSKLYHYICLQLKISLQIIKMAKNTDLWIFFMAGGLLFPLITLKLFNKKVVLCLTSSLPQIIDSHHKTPSIYKLLNLLESMNYHFSDEIIVYSPILIKQWNLEKYENKISIAHEHFLDFSIFNNKKKLDQRDFFIGYIGRLSEEKGVFNFINSIPLILKYYPNLKFIVGGDGSLQESIQNYLSSNNLNDYVILAGWISHKDLPHHLNVLKLIVIPSYTEGLPNVMLESMACGTPVLATPVGAIPDFIVDGETGFIMENNSPECIARNVIRSLGSPMLNKISENATKKIRSEFSYEIAVKNYQQIINRIM